ncbi:TrmH family RNA methyltransferase [Spiroplasma alleghenense]|uniref:RNA methyltransferase, TrmH family n=1 Tax=Spiroplasma alleghenense TaxID=216931 RepID=A0A345Z3Y2_9MOLU|nr:RNA methyltransferase [Spiroplasma alleghenense]AXK51311.1 RNA methyltransferase, TrmH family [Spiroplasma alleghenense]
MDNQKIITSLTNSWVKKILELKLTQVQREEKKFLVEGEHLVFEALKHNCLESVIVVNKENQQFRKQIPQTLVTKEVMKKISDLKNAPNIIGICHILDSKIDFTSNILVLENIQDPGNMGSLIRSAAAFNFKTIISTNNSVSYYNPKVVRATQGNLFDLNLLNLEIADVIKQVGEKNYEVVGTNLRKPSVDLEVLKNPSLKLLLLGNEGSGLSDEVSDLIEKNFIIKINPQVESLNVGVAGAIIMNLLNQ